MLWTRSRAYKKNDQAWVEQKNGAVVRRLVGYGRLSGPPARAALARLYEASRLYVNFFQPCFKLKSKQRDGALVRKTYHAPATPYDRLLESESVNEQTKHGLRKQFLEVQPRSPDWRTLVAEGYATADSVVRGTVEGFEDHTAVDGGHVYHILVAQRYKGAAGERIAVRVGGFVYRVRMNVGDTALLFLRSSGAVPEPIYALVEAERLRPMVFVIYGPRIAPADARLQPEFADLGAVDVLGHLEYLAGRR